MKFVILALSLILFATTSKASEVAISIDDFNLSSDEFVSAKERHAMILAALKKHKVQAIGFVTTKYFSSPEAAAAVASWGNAGHIVANHTEQHLNYAKVSYEEFSQDLIRAEEKLKAFKNFQKIFRFPYLKEGDTKEKRDNLRQFLSDHKYQVGAVTIDASDWYVNQRLQKKLRKEPNFDKKKFRDFYLKHLWERSQYYATLSKDLLGKDIKHNILLHHNLTTALFLDDLISMYKEKGWKVINADVAFKDPIYSKRPQNVPAGESLLWALAKESGKYEDKLRYPGEDSVYEKPEMDRLGL